MAITATAFDMSLRPWQHLGHERWSRSNPSGQLAGHPRLRAYRRTQIRSQNTGAAARGVEYSAEELQDASLPRPQAVSNGRGIQGQEKGALHDQISLGSHNVIDASQSMGKGPRIHPIELLDPRNLLQKKIKEFLRGPSQTARLYTCHIFDRIFPDVARQLGLVYHTPAPDEDRVGYHSFLRKTEETPSAQYVPSSFNEFTNACSTGDPLDALLTEIEPAVEGSYMQLFLDSHWKVLMAACRGSSEALPTLSIQDHGDLDSSHAGREDNEHCQRYLIIKNHHYGISIIRGFNAGLTSFRKALAPALLQYCQHVYRAVDPASVADVRFDGMRWPPAEFMGRAQRALGWGPITNSDENINLPCAGTSPADLWRCEIHIGKRGLVGKPALWFSRKHARLLAMLHACTALKPALQSAYQSGTILADEYQRFAQYWGESVPGAEDAADDKSSSERTKLPPSDVITVSLNSAIIGVMLNTLRRIRDIGFEGPSQWLPADETFEPRTKSPNRKHGDRSSTQVRYTRAKLDPRQVSSDPKSASLPILQPPYASIIRQQVFDSDITIIKAATGSGKTTQVPQLIFDNANPANSVRSRCSIVCTQPRRVAATTVARRVATERGQELGNEVGYQVRFDNRGPSAPNGITYMTSGYLLRLLEADPFETLSRYSHILLDEVHERDTDTDLLLTALKNMFQRPIAEVRRMPKIILMSATIDPKFFEHYFTDSRVPLKISSIEVPGKTFPITVQMLHDVLPRLDNRYHREMEGLLQDKDFKNYLDLQRNVGQGERLPTSQLNALRHEESSEPDGNSSVENPEPIDVKLENLHVPVRLLAFMIGDVLSSSSKGDILVFLPGLGEIERLERLLLEENVLNMDLADDQRYRIHKLHSALYETNYDVFKSLPTGCRRIVLATNIAETSITLPQVKFVIDTGLSRQGNYDQSTQAGSFGTRWISKAEVAQRKGRAGRTQPGTYIAAFAQGQHDLMPEKPIPELLRSNLDQIVLRTQVGKAFSMPHTEGGDVNAQPGHVLTLAPSAPGADDIAAAADQLRNLRALTADGSPTPMGKIMSQMPTTPAMAKAILLGLIFRCLDPIIFMGSVTDDLAIMNHPEMAGAVLRVRRELAGASDDDRHADWRGFAMYDKARAKGLLEEAQVIKEGRFIRHDTYCDIARTSKQVFEGLQSMIGRNPFKPYEYQQRLPQPLFASTPNTLNINSENENLVKALVLSTSGTRLGFWHQNNWRTALHQRILPAPRSVNHIMGVNKDAPKRLRREPGDVLAYGFLRVTPKDKYPWACETSVLSPLAAMMFAQSLHLAGTETLVVNDWLRYGVSLDGGNAIMDPARVAKIVLEYRKALDRFLAHAMSKIALQPRRLEMVRSGKMTAEKFNVFFQETENPIRKIFTDSVVEILDIDMQSRRQRAEQRLEEYRLQTGEPETQSISQVEQEYYKEQTANG
ncbi:hypothetical protein LTR70_006053 [Exophiala xenobiotica]|uniref:RNA helicase n=1 Tax=Lithohypha guttulata TaxID=1690604 RepID=A0ABR0KFH6_9EURO|nr:hypothetical protein LTR24_003290 [Lithohypha guttulata]KAK5316920.1 hypothetical protein LTR70_006053 [Exophiala xenobiotica]